MVLETFWEDIELELSKTEMPIVLVKVVLECRRILLMNIEIFRILEMMMSI